ncbi:MAG: polysulfide reductase NrfD [Betaproteobacteria bacterium]|nr:polysulfide reductase NrfD [Betaproteobacteria bacterium]MDE2623713.1 polysulfide reductase NrfD [Betaproteobacteria bacterium]
MTTRLSPRTELRNFALLLAAGLLVAALGLWAAHFMESRGHIVTGMNNQVVWGLPHVFAIFMIVSASGVLNVASVGSVFGRAVYKARAPLAGLLAMALLAGGLAVLMLDLGRPDRVIVAATHYNPTSVFAWNVLLYSGLFGTVALYLWTLMDRTMGAWNKPAGFLVFLWRFVLTTGTGLIFAFLVARQAYASALLPPLFIVLSLAWGHAIFLVVQHAMLRWNAMELHPGIQKRLKNLLGVFVLSVLYLVAAYHLTNAYFARQSAFERYLLLDGGAVTALFWLGYVGVGTLLPLALIFLPKAGGQRCVLGAALGVIVGAFSLLYVFIIGGQTYPLQIFPGYHAVSSFADGAITPYAPSLPEWALGLGGLGIAFLITLVGVRVLNFLPRDVPGQPVESN